MPRISRSERRIEEIEARIAEKEARLKDARTLTKDAAIAVGKVEVAKHQARLNLLTSDPNGWAAAMEAGRDNTIGANGSQGDPIKLLFNTEFTPCASFKK